MSLPASGYLSNASRTNSEMQTALEDQRDFIAQLPGGAARTELTISSGSIVPPDGDGGGHHTVDTEGAASTDDLANMTVTYTPEGRIIRLYAENASRVVTCKHAAGGSGEMTMVDSTDFVLDALDKWIEFQLRSTTWVEVGRNYGLAGIRRALTGTVLAPTKNLIVTRTTATTVDADADYVILSKSGGERKLFASLNETINITASGANGLDTGTEATSTWYFVYAIGKIDGTLDAVISTSSSAPTLPSGYDFYGLLGAVYNNSSGDIQAMTQKGNRAITSAVTILSDGAATSLTSVSLATAVPTLARAASGYVTVKSADTTVALKYVQIAPASSANGVVQIGGSRDTQNDGTNLAMGGWDILLTTAQTLYYDALPATQAKVDMYVTGWEY